MTYLITLLFLAILRQHAREESRKDDHLIANDVDINHDRNFKERLETCGIVWLLCLAMHLCCIGLLPKITGAWWLPVWWVPMGWGWWTACFRWSLNKLREKDWWYVNTGNRYDEWWIARAGTYPSEPANRPRVQLAGTLAYGTEALAFLLALAALCAPYLWRS